jgi:RecA-family ATPase
MFIDSGRTMEIILATTKKGETTIADPVVDAVIKTIKENRIDVLIIDPFVSSHRVTENDNNVIEAVVKKWAHIAEETGCAIDLSHHARKTGGGEVTVEDGRGASALLAAVRSARSVNTMTRDEADTAG